VGVLLAALYRKVDRLGFFLAAVFVGVCGLTPMVPVLSFMGSMWIGGAILAFAAPAVSFSMGAGLVWLIRYHRSLPPGGRWRPPDT
jgi:hypothetical protein